MWLILAGKKISYAIALIIVHSRLSETRGIRCMSENQNHRIIERTLFDVFYYTIDKQLLKLL